MAELSIAPGAKMLLDRVGEVCAEFGGEAASLSHALVAVLRTHGTLAGEIAGDLDPTAALSRLEGALRHGERGERIGKDTLADQAREQAQARGADRVYERDLVAAVLKLAGYRVVAAAPVPAGAPPVPAGGATAAAGGDPGERRAAAAEPGAWRPRAKRPTPLLEKIARDLTAEAAAGKLPEILGREAEIQGVVETLLRQTKRNPLLVGPAGVGKTSVAEALAVRVVRGEVPRALRDVRVFALGVADLTQGTRYAGSLEERIKKVVTEAEQDGVILFIDEIHAAVGAGGQNDVANLLKPALARGDLACIGATTDAEYNVQLSHDAAFERRFQPLRVQELSREATLEILRARAQAVGREHGVAVEPEALAAAVSLADRYMRNRYRPDKAIDVLEHAVARARAADAAAVTADSVRAVVTSMVGVPVEDADLPRRLERLADRLRTGAGLTAAAAGRIVQRLSVTLRGLDVRPLRPDAVLLALGAGGEGDALARTLAEGLFGDDAAPVDVDLSRLTHEADVSWLTGSAPGYVGYDDPRPLHLGLAQRPWSVVLLRRADLAHAAVRSTLATALARGHLTDGRGRRVYLSDTVCVLTAAGGAGANAAHRIGFSMGAPDADRANDAPDSDGDDAPPAASVLGQDLGACVDVVCVPGRAETSGEADWVRESLLGETGRAWERDLGTAVEWDESVVDWLVDRARDRRLGRAAIERLFEERVAPAVLPALGGRGRRVTVRMRAGAAEAEVFEDNRPTAEAATPARERGKE